MFRFTNEIRPAQHLVFLGAINTFNAKTVEQALLAQCCYLSCEALLFGKIWSFGSIPRQIRVHCSGCSNPADESIGLTTQPLYQGTWKAGKWTKKSRSIAQCHEIDSHHQPRLGDQWRIFSYVFLFAILICPFLCQCILKWQLAIDGVYSNLLQKYRWPFGRHFEKKMKKWSPETPTRS